MKSCTPYSVSFHSIIAIKYPSRLREGREREMEGGQVYYFNYNYIAYVIAVFGLYIVCWELQGGHYFNNKRICLTMYVLIHITFV